MKLSFIKNEKGGIIALASVLALSAIAVTSMTSAYMYIESRAKYNQMITSGYQTGFLMEEMAIELKNVYERSMMSQANIRNQDGSITANPENCPQNTNGVLVNGMAMCVPADQFSNAANIPGQFGCNQAPCFCINSRVATQVLDPQTGRLLRSRVCTNLVRQGGVLPAPARAENKIDKWLNKMDETVLQKTTVAVLNESAHSLLSKNEPTMFGWLGINKAHAKTTGVVVSPVQQELIVAPGQIGGGRDFEVNPVMPQPTIPVVEIPQPVQPGYGNGRDNPTPVLPGEPVKPPVIGGPTLPPIKPPTKPDQYKGYPVQVTSCRGNNQNELCERCQGPQCFQVRMPSVMCAGAGASCRFGNGIMNVKFE